MEKYVVIGYIICWHNPPRVEEKNSISHVIQGFALFEYYKFVNRMEMSEEND